jgi:hypothetical protein
MVLVNRVVEPPRGSVQVRAGLVEHGLASVRCRLLLVRRRRTARRREQGRSVRGHLLLRGLGLPHRPVDRLLRVVHRRGAALQRLPGGGVPCLRLGDSGGQVGGVGLEDLAGLALPPVAGTRCELAQVAGLGLDLGGGVGVAAAERGDLVGVPGHRVGGG